MAKKQPDYQKLSAELDEILAALQHPEVQIDEAITLYERGLKAVGELRTRLKQAENKLTVLKSRSADESN